MDQIVPAHEGDNRKNCRGHLFNPPEWELRITQLVHVKATRCELGAVQVA